MTREVVTVTTDMPFKQVEQLMAAHHISAVPVVDADGAAVGVISEADLLLRAEAAGDEGRDWTPGSRERHSKAEAQSAVGLMTSPVVSVAPNAPLAAAARLMRKHSVKRLPVVDEGRLVGIVSRADVLKSFLRTDDEIHADVVDGVIKASMWLDPTAFEVAVEDGVVRIQGEVERRSDVDILATLTLAIEGVIAVDSAVTYRFDDRKVTPSIEQRS